MFDNGIFGFFKSSSKEESAQEQTWNPSTMTMEQPQNYAESAQTVRPFLLINWVPKRNRKETETDSCFSQAEQPMKLRGGGEGGFCCGMYVSMFAYLHNLPTKKSNELTTDFLAGPKQLRRSPLLRMLRGLLLSVLVFLKPEYQEQPQ